MAPPNEPLLPSTNHAEVQGESTLTGLQIQGTLPARLSGRLLIIGPGSDAHSSGTRSDAHDATVHAVHLEAGRAISYRRRWLRTAPVAQRLGDVSRLGSRTTGPDIASNIVAFGGSIFVVQAGSLARELTPELDTIRTVDLAGQSRGLAPVAKLDPITGGLHVLTDAPTGAQVHVVVSRGALTRTSRTLDDAPAQITDLAVTRDRVVLAANGFIGFMGRSSDARTTWIRTSLDAPVLVRACDAGDTVVVFTVTPSLERWTLNVASATWHRAVLERAPRRFARPSDPTDGALRFLWTTGDGTADKHDLDSMSHVRRNFLHGQPGDLAFVADAARSGDADGGWLVGMVHEKAPDDTDLVVLDAADLTLIASIRIPRHIPDGVHSTWIPSTQK